MFFFFLWKKNITRLLISATYILYVVYVLFYHWCSSVIYISLFFSNDSRKHNDAHSKNQCHLNIRVTGSPTSLRVQSVQRSLAALYISKLFFIYSDIIFFHVFSFAKTVFLKFQCIYIIHRYSSENLSSTNIPRNNNIIFYVILYYIKHPSFKVYINRI